MNTQMDNSKNNCTSLLLSSSPFLRRPLLKPPNVPPSPPPLPSPSSSSMMEGNAVMDIAGLIQKSISLTADNCVRFVLSLASRNQLLNNLISSSSGSRFSQVELRNTRNGRVLSNHNFAAILPGDSVTGIVVANGVMNFLNIYNALLVVRLVLTWFPNSPPAIVSPLSTLCDPYLNIFRGIIPPLGGTLDLSPILAFTVLNAFTSTAAALPAELPGPTSSQKTRQSHTRFLGGLTASQKRWMNRVYGGKQVKEM